jgi:hypothetical protein
MTSIFFAAAYSNDGLIQLAKLATVEDKIYRQSYILSKLQLINRFAAALLMLSFGYFIDTNDDETSLFILILCILIALGISLLGLIFWSGFLMKKFNSDFHLYFYISSKKTFRVSIIANLFILLGAILPLSLSPFYYDFRATIMQSGVVFNTIGTLINVFWIEKEVADFSELKPNFMRKELAFTLLFSRLVSAIIVFLLVITIYYFVS